MRTLRASNHGVTLIELLIAMFISTIAAVALFALFIGQSRAMRQSTESMEINESVRVGLDTISRDLRSVGFLVNPGISVRIENDCGAGGGTTPPGVSWAGTFSLGGATAVDANGDVAGTAAEDGCPNGSDRLGVFYRARMDFLTEAGAPNGANPQVDWACGGPLGTDCSIPFLVAGITGTGCTGSGLGGTSDPIALCANDDPFRCLMVEIQPQGNQCDCTEAGQRCTVQFNLASTGNPMNGNDWDPVCPVASGCGGLGPPGSAQAGKVGSGIGNWTSRTYQLLDLDADGSTELAASDDINLLWTQAGTANWDVVANNIDDLQVAYALRNAPDDFINDKNLWNFTCVGNGTNDCLPVLTTAPSNPPVAIKVSLLARSETKRVVETNAGQAADGSARGMVEDNLPAFQPFVFNTTPTAGAAICYPGQTCGCGNATYRDYLHCTGNGNAQGFSRRVVTEVIGLRNLAGIP